MTENLRSAFAKQEVLSYDAMTRGQTRYARLKYIRRKGLNLLTYVLRSCVCQFKLMHAF